MAINGAAMCKLIPSLSLASRLDGPTTQIMPLHEEQQDGIYRADPLERVVQRPSRYPHFMFSEFNDTTIRVIKGFYVTHTRQALALCANVNKKYSSVSVKGGNRNAEHATGTWIIGIKFGPPATILFPILCCHVIEVHFVRLIAVNGLGNRGGLLIYLKQFTDQGCCIHIQGPTKGLDKHGSRLSFVCGAQIHINGRAAVNDPILAVLNSRLLENKSDQLLRCRVLSTISVKI